VIVELSDDEIGLLIDALYDLGVSTFGCLTDETFTGKEREILVKQAKDINELRDRLESL
jgi:hypothetical protein